MQPQRNQSLNGRFVHIAELLFCSVLTLILLSSCTETSREAKSTIFAQAETPAGNLDLPQIQDGGEMIMLTLNGPDTYYEQGGVSMGLQYSMCEDFAEKIGVRLRVEVARNDSELVAKLQKGEGDIIAAEIPVTDSLKKKIDFCGSHTDSLKHMKTSWAVRNDSPELLAAVNEWYKADTKQRIQNELNQIRIKWERSKLSHLHSFKLRPGEISPYDALFKRHARRIGWDWRLMAAIGCQESGFNAKAVSWAGACGVMQIMPSTGSQIGIKRDDLFDPATNIQGAAFYLSKLEKSFKDISNPSERRNFVLASYNGGVSHIRDAMALAAKYGKNPHLWFGNVEEYALHLSEPRYYNDPVVRHGYMRGSETFNYVRKINQRYASYRQHKSRR